MKNKKILSRILALCSVVVLLFALALPCFADEQPTTETPVYVIRQVEFTDFDSMFTWLKSNYQKVTSVSFYNSTDGVTYIGTNVIYQYDADFDYFYISSSAVVPDQSDETFYFTLGLVRSSSLDESTLLVGGWTNGSPLVNVTVPGAAWAEIGLSFTVSYMEELVTDGSATPVRSGFFGQLYYLLRDAIFGKDVVLDSSQDFTLTQIATWMTYVVILLPIILVVAIVIKAFRW